MISTPFSVLIKFTVRPLYIFCVFIGGSYNNNKREKIYKKHTKDTSTLYDVLYSTTLEFYADSVFDLLSS